MEPANIPHKPSFEDQLVCSPISLDSSGYGAASGSTHAWTPNNILCNASSYASYPNATLLNSRNPRLQNDILVSSLNPSMIKDLGLEWTNTTNNFTHHDNNLPSIHDHHLQLNPQIKREILDPYDRLSDMISSPAMSGIEDVQIPPACYNNYMKELRGMDDLSLKLLLRTLSCGGESSNGIQEKSNSFSSPAGMTSKRSLSCSQIYPTVNVNELLLNQQSSMGNSSGFGVNLEALDLFNSTRFGGSFRPPPLFQGEMGFSKESCVPYAVDFMKQSIERPLECSTSMENLSNGIAESKRPEINSERKAAKTQVGTKRSRLESRACPPFKVRKEKLSDRVAALQQLVAPFGKTDTASVLMEAIGYIKFLQCQVETLSVPYLKSSRHKNNRAALLGGRVDNGNEEQKRDLRSRGLCLVPLSCLSYVTDGGGGSMWPPPSFG